ncbi:MAG TPA: YlmC/YmxH family sporulation protein [Bacillota bacterium]|nr:YlmC/YmxH family sporulation protein [Bacillota bacterium]
MIRLSELQRKEVIIINNGKRLGYIYDLHIDSTNGTIIAIILIKREKTSWLFHKPVELFVKWSQIVTIGEDIILIRDFTTM